jgi:uncharacterized protein
MARTL